MNGSNKLSALGAALVLFTGSAAARAPAPPPPTPVRVALTDAVIVGRIVGHEPKDVSLPPFPGAEQKVLHRIAVLKVTEMIKGEKKAKTVRIAFPAPEDGGPIVGQWDRLEEGVEGLFYLARHHQDKDFFVARGFYDVVPAAKNDNFDKEVKTARAAGKLLENPLAGLKCDKTDDRQMTAAMLIYQYRSRRSPKTKTEAIPAEESKLILKALHDADWKRRDEFGLGPFELFMRLGLTEKDGWKSMDDVEINRIRAAAQEWLAKNGDTYRIRRYVAD